jgi:DNA-binding response OmpR family regulator
VEERKSTILIIEDDLDIADMLNAYFRVQGYEVNTATWGEDGIKLAQSSHPDLVILDIQLPDIDGFEVARQLRANRRTQDIPIIFLTEKRERHSRLKGLELQADDYITKPFDIQELRLRVRNSLQRNLRGSLTNPVTGVPEGGVVDEHLTQILNRGEWSLLLVMLKNLNRFRDIYGFVAQDDLLRAVILMIDDSIKQFGSPDDFLGHITATDFIVLTRPVQIEKMANRIAGRLEQSFGYFYRDQDLGGDIFQGNHLAVKIKQLHLAPGKYRDVPELKEVLEQLLRRESN